jgi:hypothetical protein
MHAPTTAGSAFFTMVQIRKRRTVAPQLGARALRVSGLSAELRDDGET